MSEIQICGLKSHVALNGNDTLVMNFSASGIKNGCSSH